MHDATRPGLVRDLRLAAARLDASVDGIASRVRGRAADVPAHLLSSGADRSKVWVGIAAVRAVSDRPLGRRAAARALASVAVESMVVHAMLKPITRRMRPSADVRLRFGARRPPSSSFPSGHAASAATAAVLLSDRWPGSGAPLAALAAGIAWSRVQTGLHHATDVAAGLALGVGVGLCVKRLVPLP